MKAISKLVMDRSQGISSYGGDLIISPAIFQFQH